MSDKTKAWLGLLLKIILLVVAALLVFGGLFYAFNGSMEMFPTDEQQGKAKIAGAIIALIGVAFGVVGIIIKPKRPLK